MSRASTSSYSEVKLVVTVVYNFLTPLASPFTTPPHGHGSRAIDLIPAGTTVATFGGLGLPRHEFDVYPSERRSRSIQVNLDLIFLGPPAREPGDSINHSCDPNCGMRNATSVVTMRDVEEGEELTFDYAMSDASNYDEFDCNCNSVLCRGTVRADDWKLEPLRHRYAGYFSPYIQRLIASEKRGALLTKNDVELLMSSYDNDPVRALTQSLRKVFGMPHATWHTLIERVEHDAARRSLLFAHDEVSLDHLVSLLNETRGSGL